MPQRLWTAKLTGRAAERIGRRMVTKKILFGGNILLRQIEMEDCTDSYVKWLNDSEVTQYLETKWSIQNLETIRDFVDAQRKNTHSILLAIITKENNVHIGNIKIGPVLMRQPLQAGRIWRSVDLEGKGYFASRHI